MVLGLFEDYLLDQPVKLKWVVGRADHGPGRILLHLVLEQLSALSKDKRVCACPWWVSSMEILLLWF